MASACIIVAVESGMTHIHTGIPPLADGDAQPSVFTTVRNLHELGYDTGIDLEPLQRASDKLSEIARRERFPVGAPVDLDYRHYRHQIPGGMISHLVYQLNQVGQIDRLPEVLAETARVRAEFGYPVMVTPLSQFVGSQAAVNVITGVRYGSVTDEAIRYALGHYGAEAPGLMDERVRDEILGHSRAVELAQAIDEPGQSLDELRNVYGDVTDEQLVHLTQCGPTALALLREQPDIAPYRFESAEATWLRKLPGRRGERRHFEVRSGELTMRVGLSGESLRRSPSPVAD
jgi:oxaloacetate decarboxylase alpha subunit